MPLSLRLAKCNYYRLFKWDLDCPLAQNRFHDAFRLSLSCHVMSYHHDMVYVTYYMWYLKSFLLYVMCDIFVVHVIYDIFYAIYDMAWLCVNCYMCYGLLHVMCILSLLEWINDLEHSLWINGFSPECILRWVLRCLEWENDLWHSLQLNGFSPEWSGLQDC